jgi:hypothetical protein
MKLSRVTNAVKHLVEEHDPLDYVMSAPSIVVIVFLLFSFFMLLSYLDIDHLDAVRQRQRECEESQCPLDMKPYFDREMNTGTCRCYVAPVRNVERR